MRCGGLNPYTSLCAQTKKKKKTVYSWRNPKAFRLSLCAAIIASFYFLPVFLCFPFLYETKYQSKTEMSGKRFQLFILLLIIIFIIKCC